MMTEFEKLMSRLRRRDNAYDKWLLSRNELDCCEKQ